MRKQIISFSIHCPTASGKGSSSNPPCDPVPQTSPFFGGDAGAHSICNLPLLRQSGEREIRQTLRQRSNPTDHGPRKQPADRLPTQDAARSAFAAACFPMRRASDAARLRKAGSAPCTAPPLPTRHGCPYSKSPCIRRTGKAQEAVSEGCPRRPPVSLPLDRGIVDSAGTGMVECK